LIISWLYFFVKKVGKKIWLVRKKSVILQSCFQGVGSKIEPMKESNLPQKRLVVVLATDWKNAQAIVSRGRKEQIRT
jgi:hypothetical protein